MELKSMLYLVIKLKQLHCSSDLTIMVYSRGSVDQIQPIEHYNLSLQCYLWFPVPRARPDPCTTQRGGAEGGGGGGLSMHCGQHMGLVPRTCCQLCLGPVCESDSAEGLVQLQSSGLWGLMSLTPQCSQTMLNFTPQLVLPRY